MTELMHCPECLRTVEVSDEDPDASQSYMLAHLFEVHANYDRDESMRLLALVTVNR
jgi:hypothetical protein